MSTELSENTSSATPAGATGIDPAAADPGEGHSPAAWTGVVIMLLGFTLGTLFYWFNLPWAVIASAVVIVIGPIVGAIMRRAGYGVGGSKLKPKEH